MYDRVNLSRSISLVLGKGLFVTSWLISETINE